MNASINCSERPEYEAEGAQKPECTQSTRGFRAPLNEVIRLRNRFIEAFYRLLSRRTCTGSSLAALVEGIVAAMVLMSTVMNMTKKK